jgi:hypothetical protein
MDDAPVSSGGIGGDEQSLQHTLRISLHQVSICEEIRGPLLCVCAVSAPYYARARKIGFAGMTENLPW